MSMLRRAHAAVASAFFRSRCDRLFKKYGDATMLSKTCFRDNLSLVNLQKSLLNDGLAIVECGTWRGGLSAAMVEITQGRAQYHFFDSFEGLPAAAPVDGASALAWQSNPDGRFFHDNCSATLGQFETTMERSGADRKRVHICKGWFENTLPSASVGQIAILRLDADWYASTAICLEHFFDMVVPGGVIIIDDYGTWDGCTRAVHDYLSSRGRAEPVERFGSTNVAFIRIRG